MKADRFEIISSRTEVLHIVDKWMHWIAAYTRVWSEEEQKLHLGELAQLEKLDLATVSYEVVEGIIKRPLGEMCTLCEKRFHTVLRLGEEPDYNSCTIHACRECIDEAAEKLRKAHD